MCRDIPSCARLTVSSNVFLRNTPRALYRYGTTDVMLGRGTGHEVVGNEFVLRGEWPGAPDGCAVDFEMNSTGVTVRGNYFFRSHAAAVMVYGHESFTNRDTSIVSNTIVQCGCQAKGGDRGAIAVLHANASGSIADNTFVGCGAGLPPDIYTPHPSFLETWHIVNNRELPASSMVLVLPTPDLHLSTASPCSTVSASLPKAAGTQAVLRCTNGTGAPTLADHAPPLLACQSMFVCCKAFAQANLLVQGKPPSPRPSQRPCPC